MAEPPSPTVGAESTVVVVGADEQPPGGGAVDLDVDRWCRLAGDVLHAERASGELTLTFVSRDEIAALNEEHLGGHGPTDVLAFPLDDEAGDDHPAIPVLLGDVVVCPEVARDQAPNHAGSLEDELALLVVHGVLHVLGHDHAESAEAELMRSKERELLIAHHWRGQPPLAFRQEHENP